MTDPGDITALLRRARDGDSSAENCRINWCTPTFGVARTICYGEQPTVTLDSKPWFMKPL
jgi:hypothetical protein